MDYGFPCIQHRSYVNIKMAQEIITYIIITAAVFLALWKMYIKLWGKKLKVKSKTNFQNVTHAPKHNCSDCIAECSLRDAMPVLRKENEELCETTVIKVTES